MLYQGILYLLTTIFYVSGDLISNALYMLGRFYLEDLLPQFIFNI